MAALDQESLQQNLKKRRVCRFCLTKDQMKLSNIYMENTRIKTSAPLPLQIMAIASIEVFNNDGMPSYVCTDCAALFEYSYQFKQMCQRAENLLRLYPLTGKWPRTLEHPVLASKQIQQISSALNIADKHQYFSTPAGQSFQRKLDISNAVPSSDPARPQRLQTSFLSKLENNNLNRLDYMKHLVAAAGETPFENREQLPVEVTDSGNRTKPKMLNKFSLHISNKDVGCEKEPNVPKNAEVRKTIVEHCCQHCDKTYPLMRADIYSKSHSQDRHCKCDESEQSKLKSHGAIPFKYTTYDRALPRTSISQWHEKTNNSIQKYICETCKRPYVSKKAMDKCSGQHKMNCRFQCKICNKRFAFKHGLQMHEVIRSRQQRELDRAIRQEQGSRKRVRQSVKPELHDSSDENNMIAPSKQAKYEGAGRKHGARPPSILKEPQATIQLTHKSAKPAAVNLPVKDKNQSSSMQSMLKLSRDYYARVKKTSKTPDKSPKGSANQAKTTVPRQ